MELQHSLKYLIYCCVELGEIKMYLNSNMMLITSNNNESSNIFMSERKYGEFDEEGALLYARIIIYLRLKIAPVCCCYTGCSVRHADQTFLTKLLLISSVWILCY